MTTVPDVWELEVEAPDWLRTILILCLEAGIPPTALARAFKMAVDPIKDLLIDLRVEKYGTAEMGELVTFLAFEAVDDIRKIRDQAPPARRLSLNMALISRMSALVGSQTPDTMAKLHGELATVLQEMRTTSEEVTSSIYETVATDAPTDNPEERPPG